VGRTPRRPDGIATFATEVGVSAGLVQATKLRGVKKKRLRASTVCEADGHLLVVRLRDPASGVEAFYPPGGGIEEGEAPVDAARRETLEETGLHVEVDAAGELVATYPFVWNANDYDVTTHFFYATSAKSDLPAVVDADYHRGAKWLPTLEALDEMAVHPAIAAPVGRLLNRRHRVAWEADPRMRRSQHAPMLLAIHDQFRAASRRIATDPRIFVPLAEVLHHHHHAEEVMLFPSLDTAARLEEGHRELTAAIATAEDEPTPENLARFSAVLEAHLDREELQVIPVLLRQ
jgi:ADP-ribose pyrophosphatase YjhB (NUDIX family)